MRSGGEDKEDGEMRTAETEQHGAQESKETGEMEGKGGGIGKQGR